MSYTKVEHLHPLPGFDGVLTRHEAARALRTSEQTIDRLIKSGQLVHSKFNRTVLISADSVRALMPKRTAAL